MRQLPWSDRLLLSEALATLAAASLAVRLLPFRKLILQRSQAQPREPRPSVDITRLRWAVDACGRRARFRAVCLERALCLRAMLRRRGVPSELHYGIALEEGGGEIKAHVWLSVEGQVVIGGEAAVGYARVASFPG